MAVHEIIIFSSTRILKVSRGNVFKLFKGDLLTNFDSYGAVVISSFIRAFPNGVYNHK